MERCARFCKEGTDKYRLLSEVEWDYAARAGTTTRYSFGDDTSREEHTRLKPECSACVSRTAGGAKPTGDPPGRAAA